jgi:lipid II:glycine glycyltransferase (peptidoglycan interpeptide bridge formation enzyme)
VGGNLCVELPNKILYEWFVCGEDRKYKNIFPSTLATWAAIEYASKNNFAYFDMMGAGKPDESYGVREFKSKFGGELVEHGRFLSVLNPYLFSLGKFAVKIIKSR